MLGWTLEEKIFGSGVWLFRGALQGKNLFSSLDAVGDWVRKGSYTQRGRSPVIPRALVRIRTGKAPQKGHTLDSGAGHCLKVYGGAIAPNEALVC